MKKINLLFSFLVITTLITSSVVGFNYYKNEKTPKKVKKTEAQIAYEAMLYRQSLIKNVETGTVDMADFYRATNQALALRASGSRAALGLNWEEMGPDNVGGRTRAVLVDKNNSNHVFAGGVSGGLWESTNGGLNWSIVTPIRDLAGGSYLSISCIAQSGNTIYVGTGEAFNGAHPGNGVYKSTDNGATWSHLSSTSIPTIITPGGNFPWSLVADIAVDPTNPDHVYASLDNSGLTESRDGGLTWSEPAGILNNTNSGCVKIGNDGNLIYAVINGNKIWRSNDAGVTWTHLTQSGNPLSTFPAMSITTRTQIAIAPSDNNYTYLSCNSASGCISGVFKTVDGGISWSQILGAGSSADPMAQPGGGSGCQGWYDHCIAVVPNDETQIYVGGITLWSYSEGLSWKRSDQLGTEGVGYDSPHYVHADKHTIVFDPNNPEVMYIGQDGGVSKTSDAHAGFPTPTFKSLDKDYRVTQYYGVAANKDGWMLAGSQDNGSHLIDFNGNTARAAKEARGGDGFASDMSSLNTNIMFASVYTSDMQRSGNKGVSFGGFFDSKIDPDGSGEPGTCDGCSPFFTFGSLMETKTANNSIKNAVYKNTGTSVITSGTTIQILSNTGVTFPYTLMSDLNIGDSVSTRDVYDAKYFLATSLSATPGCGAWVCINPLNITQNPKWFKLPIPQQMQAIDFSKDGNTAYIGAGGTLYRITGFNTATYNYTTGVITGLTTNTCALPAPSRTIGGVGVDPNDENHVAIARTGYGSTGTVAHSTNGINFTDVSGDLPRMPAYDIVIDANDADNYIVGTELGIWSTDNRGTNWVEENSGLAGNDLGWVPVYRLRQYALFEDACPVIYAGTHGRGMWRCTSLTPTACKTSVGIREATVGTIANKSLSVYPNPTSNDATISLTLVDNASIDINILSLSGKLVSTEKVNGVEGKNEFKVNLANLASGSYIVSVRAGSKETLSKVIIKN